VRFILHLLIYYTGFVDGIAEHANRYEVEMLDAERSILDLAKTVGKISGNSVPDTISSQIYFPNGFCEIKNASLCI